MSLQYDYVELQEKNPTYFPSHMRMCWKLNSLEKKFYVARGSTKKMELRLLSDIKFHSAQEL